MDRNNIQSAQLSMRHKKNIEELRPVISEIKENKDKDISFHMAGPSFLEDGTIKNEQALEDDMRFVMSLGGGLITIHPGAIPEPKFREAGSNFQQAVVENFSNFLARTLDLAKKKDQNLIIAVENLPNKGDQGNWGQKIEEIKTILSAIRQKLVINYNFDASETERRVGITLDINHALENVSDENKIHVLEKWMKECQYNIRCFHVYTPGLDDNMREKNFESKIQAILEMYRKYALDVPLYLESKKDLNTTEKAFQISINTIKK